MKFSIQELKDRSAPGHEYGYKGTGSQVQIVCSCGWRSKVWGRDTEHPVNEQWLAHLASMIPHKVVVAREATADDCGIGYIFQLYKEVDGRWQLCNSDDPGDAAAFQAVRLIDWSARASGDHPIEARDIADAV